jgi:HemY protein
MRAAPRIGWAGGALFEYQARAADWDSALQTLAVNVGTGVVDRAKAKRLRAVLLTARATELEAGEPDRARGLALEAHKLAPDLVPAATVAARLLSRHGDIRRASRVLEATWKLSPHPEIAEAYADVRPGDAPRDRLRRVRRLAELRANHAEGALAVARAAIDAHEWQEARNALGGPTRASPTERVCLLMAEIEEGENGDQGRVRSWLTRALSAPRDPAWMADGHVFDRWAPVSPVSGRIDALEWRLAADRLPPPRRDLEVPAEASDDSPGAPAVVAETPPAQPVSLPSVVRSARPPAGDTKVTALGASAGSAAKATGPRPMARAPDDPGPAEPDDEDDSGGLTVFHPGRTA